MKSRYGPGGEFEPDWYVLLSFTYFKSQKKCRTPPGQPPAHQPPTDPPNPPMPPMPELTDPPIARPAWRIYHPRKRKKKEPKASGSATTVQPQQAGPSHMGPSPMDRHLRQQVASWSTWHRKFIRRVIDISIFIDFIFLSFS